MKLNIYKRWNFIVLLNNLVYPIVYIGRKQINILKLDLYKYSLFTWKCTSIVENINFIQDTQKKY